MLGRLNFPPAFSWLDRLTRARCLLRINDRSLPPLQRLRAGCLNLRPCRSYSSFSLPGRNQSFDGCSPKTLYNLIEGVRLPQGKYMSNCKRRTVIAIAGVFGAILSTLLPGMPAGKVMAREPA